MGLRLNLVGEAVGPDPLPFRLGGCEEQHVWELLYRRQVKALRYCGHPDVIPGLQAFELGESLPDLEVLSGRMFDRIGWRLRLVPDQVSAGAFIACLADRTLPTTGHVRGRDELVHSRFPDMFHDLFGHLPLLINVDYRALLTEYVGHAQSLGDESEAAQRLATAFKWIVEYGLIACGGVLRACGAGLLSSSEELAHALGPETEKIPFDAHALVTTRHVPATLQPGYFVLPGFAPVRAALPAIVDAALAASGGR